MARAERYGALAMVCRVVCAASTLLQVQIKETDDHDRLFSELMGDLVEPRRDFIQDNALNVANLDV